jgi:UDP-N-acetylmuramyl pentapeptide phosphotransferase/UDP-N-acetylglucosamine-1-phosphate transferase
MPELQELEHDPPDPRRCERIAMVTQMPGLAAVWMLIAFLLALIVVRGAIGYARRKGMLDQPGQRRSHRVPTPRGGGIGIIAATLACMPASGWLIDPAVPVLPLAAIWLGTLLVAAIGWWDDHHDLPVLPRLAAHAVAALLVGVSLNVTGLSWAWLPLLVLAGCGSINLHNFMDGIDGLLAQQAIFVFLGTGVIAFDIGQAAWAGVAFAAASATAGFLVYNWAPARIFMGDVGSGALGFLVFALGAWLWFIDRSSLWAIIILSSAFVVDAGLTLLVRIMRGKRWYSAHREHAYQWLVRRGIRHGSVCSGYLIWNIVVVAPIALWARAEPAFGLGLCIALYLASGLAWLVVKRLCLRLRPHGNTHVGT